MKSNQHMIYRETHLEQGQYNIEQHKLCLSCKSPPINTIKSSKR